MFGPLKEPEARCLACWACGLWTGCRQVVFGEGDPSAAVMFVSEAPRAEEDRQRRPFVSAAGRLLNRLLACAGFSRVEVYITNLVNAGRLKTGCLRPGRQGPAAPTCLSRSS